MQHNFPQHSSDFHTKPAMREIPVHHEGSPIRQQTPYSMSSPQPWQQQHQYPQQSQAQATPPRTGTPPLSASGRPGTPPRFATMPRNHRERVREIPIQHMSSSSMSSPMPGQGGQMSHQSEMPQPRPDYPGYRDNHYPQQQMPQPQGIPQQQMYPPQSVPMSQPNYSSQSYPGGVSSGAPVSTQPPQGYQQCAPPTQQQEVMNIPILHEGHRDMGPMGQSYQTWPRQPKPERQYSDSPPRPTEPKPHYETVPPKQPENLQSSASAQVKDQPDGNAQQPPETVTANHSHSHAYGNGQAAQQGKGQAQQAQTETSSSGQGQPGASSPQIDIIMKILAEVKQYETRVNTFSGKKKDKEYKLLEEMLTRSIIKLDSVESGSDENIRNCRKQAVREIQSFLDQLELKAFSSAMDTSDNSSGKEAMDTSSQSSEVKSSEKDPAAVNEMVLESEVSC